MFLDERKTDLFPDHVNELDELEELDKLQALNNSPFQNSQQEFNPLDKHFNNQTDLYMSNASQTDNEPNEAGEISNLNGSGQAPASPTKKNSLIQYLLEYVVLIIVAVLLALFINRFVIFNANVPTGSMTYTIMENDRLIGLRFSYYFSDPKRGEIIIFRYPDDPSQYFIKRVIGTPGDFVEIKATYNILGEKEVNVYVNGEKLYEPYIREPMEINSDLEYYVPPDSYFVMGDNRNNSLDSRYWQNTFVPRKNVIAKAVFKYHPKFKFINTKY